MLPLHYTVYAATVLFVPLLTKDLMSFSRYAVTAWPVFLVLVLRIPAHHHRWALPTLTLLLLAGRLTMTYRFVNWQWVG